MQPPCLRVSAAGFALQFFQAQVGAFFKHLKMALFARVGSCKRRRYYLTLPPRQLVVTILTGAVCFGSVRRI